MVQNCILSLSKFRLFKYLQLNNVSRLYFIIFVNSLLPTIQSYAKIITDFVCNILLTKSSTMLPYMSQLSYPINFYYLSYKCSMWLPPATRTTSIRYEDSFRCVSCRTGLIAVGNRSSRLISTNTTNSIFYHSTQKDHLR